MKEILPDHEVTARVEAALYSSGRPLSMEELTRASGTHSKEKTAKVVDELIKKTKAAFRAIEIARLPDGNFVFQLKSDYLPLARRFAQQPLISAAALKTLSYIAYEQPVTSKRLAQIRGSQVYTQIKELEQLQFVEHENLGRLKVFRTTRKFQDYFGINDFNTMKNTLISTANKKIQAVENVSVNS